MGVDNTPNENLVEIYDLLSEIKSLRKLIPDISKMLSREELMQLVKDKGFEHADYALDQNHDYLIALMAIVLAYSIKHNMPLDMSLEVAKEMMADTKLVEGTKVNLNNETKRS